MITTEILGNPYSLVAYKILGSNLNAVLIEREHPRTGNKMWVVMETGGTTKKHSRWYSTKFPAYKRFIDLSIGQPIHCDVWLEYIRLKNNLEKRSKKKKA